MNLTGQAVYQKGAKRKRQHKSVAEMAHPASGRGTDAEFLNWLTYQPSCLDGGFSFTDEQGKPRNVACHVRRVAAGAGMATKPIFSAVPMTDEQHKLQHQRGEMAVIEKYCIGVRPTSPEQAKQWFETEAAEHLQRWQLEKENKWL